MVAFLGGVGLINTDGINVYEPTTYAARNKPQEVVQIDTNEECLVVYLYLPDIFWYLPYPNYTIALYNPYY